MIGMGPSFIVYTFRPGVEPECHAYGPLTEQNADALVARLDAEDTAKTLVTMKLVLESPPA